MGSAGDKTQGSIRVSFPPTTTSSLLFSCSLCCHPLVGRGQALSSVVRHSCRLFVHHREGKLLASLHVPVRYRAAAFFPKLNLQQTVGLLEIIFSYQRVWCSLFYLVISRKSWYTGARYLEEFTSLRKLNRKERLELVKYLNLSVHFPFNYVFLSLTKSYSIRTRTYWNRAFVDYGNIRYSTLLD